MYTPVEQRTGTKKNSYIPVEQRATQATSQQQQTSTFRETIQERMPFTMGGRSLQMTQEDRLKQIDRESGTFKDTPYRQGGTISAGETPLESKIRKALPQWAEDYIYDPLKEGLVGKTGEQGDRGIVNFLTGLKTKDQKIDDRADDLIKGGVDKRRAYDIAYRDVESGGLIGKMRGGEQLEDLTEEERKILTSAGRWESFDMAMFILDVTPGKSVSTGIRTARKKILEYLTKESGVSKVRNVLRTELNMADDVAEELAPKIARTNDVNQIRAIIEERAARSASTQRVPTVARTADDVAPAMARTADEALPTPDEALPTPDEALPTVARTADDVAPTITRTADEALPTTTKALDDATQQLARTSDDLARTASEMKKAGKTFDDWVLDITDSSIAGKGRTYQDAQVTQRNIGDFNLEKQAIGKVNRTQYKTSPEVVNEWVKRIENGERPAILTRTGLSESQEWIMDGHNRLKAYQELGFKKVPTVTTSQLRQIWNNAPTTTAQRGTTALSESTTQQASIATDIISGAKAKTRKFITSVKKNLDEEVAKRVHGQYIPRSTDKLSKDARELIENNFALAQKIASEGTDDKAIATAVELLKHYNEKGMYDEAAELAMKIAPKLTELGRSIQAAALLSRLTPEGQLKLAARAIEEWNKANPWKKARKLSAEESEHILKEMNDIDAMDEGIDKAFRFYKLQKYISELVPSSFFRKAINVWKAGLLTALKTTGLNIFSNVAHAASEIVKDVPASAVDSIASLFTGERTKAFTLGGQKGGMKDGVDKGWTYLKTGFDERNIGEKLDYKQVSFGKGKVGKMFQFYSDTVFRTMGAADQPTYYGAVARSITDQAIARGKTKGLKRDQLKAFVKNLQQNPDEEMVLTAVRDGKTAVFQQDTKLGELAGAMVNSIPALEFIIPFRRTPSAVAMQIYNYTPAGPVTEIARQILKRKFEQRAFSEAVGRGVTGLGVLYLGYLAYQQGMVALDYPNNEREREQWKNEGKKPNTILIDGKWRNPIVLGPLGNLLLIGAHYDRAYQEEGSLSSAAIQGSFGAIKSFTEQTFLTGISSLMDAVNDPQRSGTSFIAGQLSSVIPTIISDVARATDPVQRRTADPEGAIATILNRIRARVPLLREELEPVLTSLGEEQKRDGNFLETMLDPTRPSRAISTPVIDELKRLTDVGYNVSPTLTGDKIGYESLSGEENTIMWMETGSLTRQKLEGLFEKEAYQRLSDEEKSDMINDFVSKSKDEGRARTILRLTRGMTQVEYREALSKYKEDGLLTEKVYRRLEALQSQ